MASTVQVLAGTRKGLFVLESDERRTRWRTRGPYLQGQEINHATLDRRTGTIYATANSAWFGGRISYSKDFGKTWMDAEQSPAFEGDSGKKLERIWHVEPGLERETNVLYCGVAPAALFRSEDSGATWSEVTGLSGHPTREKWAPGAGGLCLHSILLDSSNADRLWVGISAVGVFRTDDGGKSWTTHNKKVRADFLPEEEPEIGQCVHDLVFAGDSTSRLYQQNHCGVYRSDDGADTWEEITEGLPSDFGFPIAPHPRDHNVAYVVPLQGAGLRCPPGKKLRVFRTTDAGKTWEPLSKGLPQRGAFMGIYREALCGDGMDPAGFYLATNTGHIYVSADEGDTWKQVTANLPPVSSVSATVLD